MYQRILLTAVAVLVALSCASASDTVRMVQVMHRHGSRTPIVPTHQDEICGPTGCGTLNKEGVDMLKSLGRWAREKWNGPLQEALGGNEYNDRVVRSWSTDVPRTIQSSDSFLFGLFPNVTVVPVVHTLATSDDDYLLVDNIQSYAVHGSLVAAEHYSVIGRRAAELGITTEVISELSRASGLGHYCEVNVSAATYQQLGHCALTILDIVQCNEAAGKVVPVLEKWQPSLQQLLELSNQRRFAYNETDPLHQKRGALGYNAVEEIAYMFDVKSQGLKTIFLQEYSTHDTLITPVYAAMGHNEMMLPRFAQMLAIEMVETSDPKEFFLQAWGGHPTQTPGDHSYEPNTEKMSLFGKSANGTTYSAMRMPLDDWTRFIKSRKGSVSNGKCYVSAEDVKAIGCDKVDVVPNHTSCIAYRRHCPRESCPSGSYLNHSTLMCVAPKAPEHDDKLSVVLVSLCAGIGGALVGLALAGLALKQHGGRRG